MKQPQLSDVKYLAHQAGEILRNNFGRKINIGRKGVIDLVTEVDHKVEAFLLGEIQSRFPSHQIIAEESGEQQGDERSRWYIDPLDGTVNYAHGIPVFTTSIAYAHNGVVSLATVYDPMQDECYTAVRGEGVWLNGESIMTSSTTELSDSLMVTGFPYDIWTAKENNLDHYVNFSLCTQGVRRLGSAALDLCYVAAGRFDGFWEISISSWDIAAGGLIAKEAGAEVTDIRGNAAYLSDRPTILAANPKLHPKMLEVLWGTSKD